MVLKYSILFALYFITPFCTPGGFFILLLLYLHHSVLIVAQYVMLLDCISLLIRAAVLYADGFFPYLRTHHIIVISTVHVFAHKIPMHLIVICLRKGTENEGVARLMVILIF